MHCRPEIRMLPSVKIFVIMRGWRSWWLSSERKESAEGAFLHIFGSVKGNCVYALSFAWENQIGESKIE